MGRKTSRRSWLGQIRNLGLALDGRGRHWDRKEMNWTGNSYSDWDRDRLCTICFMMLHLRYNSVLTWVQLIVGCSGSLRDLVRSSGPGLCLEDDDED